MKTGKCEMRKQPKARETDIRKEAARRLTVMFCGRIKGRFLTCFR
jgi:hypothetical protein